jgi:linoleoyl-CoA desaturase
MSVHHIRDVAQTRLTFKRDNAFHKELRRRVDDYFKNSDRSPRDNPAVYLKTAIILAAFAGFYFLLVFVAESWWQALPLAALLGLSMAAIRFNIEHDGSHHSYSNHAWINRRPTVSRCPRTWTSRVTSGGCRYESFVS